MHPKCAAAMRGSMPSSRGQGGACRMGVYPKRQPQRPFRDSYHSTVAYTDDRLPRGILRTRESRFRRRLSPGFEKKLSGGNVTGTDWVSFFPGVSLLSLLMADYFVGPVIGADT